MRFELVSKKVTKKDVYRVYDRTGRDFGKVEYWDTHAGFTYQHPPTGFLTALEASCVAKFLEDLDTRLEQ